MDTLTELETQFDLSNWERKLGNKRTKAGKYFWLFVLFNYKEAMKGHKPFDLRLVCKEYGHIFYRLYESMHHLLTQYEGQPTATMRKNLNIGDTKDYFTIRFKMNSLELESRLRNWLNNYDGTFDSIPPETVELIDLDFLDHKHPHLPTISQSYKRLLDSANHRFKQNKLMIDRRWKLKPSTVKTTFNAVMDNMIRYEYLIHVADHLREYLTLSFETFRAKNRVDGPTYAVRQIVALNPEVAGEYTDKQLKYHVKLRYADPDGKDFKNDSVRKAIKNYRDEQSKKS